MNHPVVVPLLAPIAGSSSRFVGRAPVLVLACVVGALLSACSFSSGPPPGAGAAGGGAGGPGTGGNGPAIEGLSALRLEPSEAEIVTGPTAAGMQAFKAVGTVKGEERDLTAMVRWSSTQPAVATIVAPGVAGANTVQGGRTQIHAGVGSLDATANLHVVFKRDVALAGGSTPLPADPATSFTGTAVAGHAPALIYPNDGVVLPPNLGQIELHFRPASSADTLFAVSFDNADTHVSLFTRCVPLGDGCVVVLADDVWSNIAETNRGGSPVTVQVKGAADAGGGFGASASQTLSFAKDALQGALYYWTTSGDTSIFRWNFGDKTQKQPELVVDNSSTKGVCVGCHVISRDGTKMFLSTGGPDEGDVLLFDLVNRRPLAAFPTPQPLRFGSWSPDGSVYVATFMKKKPDLMLLDGTTGAMTGSIPLGGKKATHPDWSPDGQRIVFTEIGEWTGSDARPRQTGVSFVEKSGAGWSAVKTLVPSAAGFGHYYPTVAPDNTLVVYNASTCPAGQDSDATCDGYEDPSARLWAAPLPPTQGAPVELARANAPGVADGARTDLENSFPKWSPFVFQRSEQSQVMWVTFSSTRNYGLRTPPKKTGGDADLPLGTLIWMAAVDPAVALSGKDPSEVAFCLPFQSLTTSNHTAQWTSSVPPPPF